MTADDALYSPIFPVDKLKKLIKRLLNNPSEQLLDQISGEIVDLFAQHGVNDEQEIVDAVYRARKELDVLQFIKINNLVVNLAGVQQFSEW